MGVISEALDGVSVRQVAAKIGQPWQTVLSARRKEDKGVDVDAEITEQIVAAAGQLKSDPPQRRKKERPKADPRRASRPQPSPAHPENPLEVGVESLMADTPKPKIYLLNEQHELSRGEAQGGGRQNSFSGIDWAPTEDVWDLLRQFRELGDRIASEDPDGRRLIAALSSKWSGE